MRRMNWASRTSMRTFNPFIKTAALAGVLVLLASCNRDALQDLFAKRCSEGKTQKVEQLGPNATCNGVPMLVALAGAPEIAIDLDEFRYMSDHGFDPNVQEPGTGRTPLMIAIDSKNV